MRLTRVAVLVGVVGALVLALVPAAGSITTTERLFAFVRVTNPGPLPACAQDGSNCTGANRVDNFIYVVNGNRLTDLTGRGVSRATLPNSFVVESVTQRVFVDGVEFGAPFVLTPPPNPSFRPWAGHWPATVTCAAPGPCANVVEPAIVPGEVGAILYAGWIHGDAEPKGTYVFRYEIQGTLEGIAVFLRAQSQPIEMT